jgi:polyketide synthase PksN
VDADAFAAAFRHVIAQHPLLSAAVVMGEGGPRWEARPVGDVVALGDVVVLGDVSGLPDDDVIADLARRAKVPFVLADGGLVRVELLRRSAEESFVLFVIHHIVFDAGSVVPFLSEVLEAYRARREGGSLPASNAPSAQSSFHPSSSSSVDAYAGYVAWERRFLASSG